MDAFRREFNRRFKIYEELRLGMKQSMPRALWITIRHGHRLTLED